MIRKPTARAPRRGPHQTVAILSLLVTGGLAAAPYAAHAESSAAEKARPTPSAPSLAVGGHDASCEEAFQINPVDPASVTLLGLADCQVARGHLLVARSLLRTILEKLPQGDSRAASVALRLAQVEARLPKVTLQLSAEAPHDTSVPEGTLEISATAFGAPLPMDPGKHTLTITAAGHEPRAIYVDLAEAQDRELSIVVGPRIVVDPGRTAPAAATA